MNLSSCYYTYSLSLVVLIHSVPPWWSVQTVFLMETLAPHYVSAAEHQGPQHPCSVVPKTHHHCTAHGPFSVTYHIVARLRNGKLFHQAS